MNNKRYIGLAALMLSLGATAQTNKTLCDFETEDSYASVGVYDTWANSPFRTGVLNGNAAVVSNHLNEVDAVLGYAPNTSSYILGVQRSRFGSNTFGALVGLKTPFALTKTQQYVHVMIYTPKETSVMLIGLGNRDDRPSQSPLTEQFWSTATSKVTAGQWSDAVFPISGANGITIRNLLVVVDRNSTHDMTDDYAAYIDNIVLSDSKTPFFSSTPYPINYDEATTLSRSDRYTSSIGLTSADGTQTATVDQQTSKKLYIKRLDNCFLAKPGETVTPTIGYNGSWMAGYAYIDKGNDGTFNVTYTDDAITDQGDLMSYALFKNYTSKGTYVSGSPDNNPPSFTIPSDLTPGIYRMRYKIDWDNVDPGGNPGPSNKITDNGGVIVDTRINVHGTTVNLSRAVDGLGGGLNGDILLADGTPVTDKTAPFGEALKVKVAPANGFRFSHVLIRHGYNLEKDSMMYENLQWKEECVDASAFTDNEYTIPASMVDGDLRFVPYFSSNTTPEKVALDIVADGGHVVGADYSGVADSIKYGQEVTLLPIAPASGYVLKSLTVRHGQQLNGPEYSGTVRQWSEYTVEGAAADEEFTIPADCVDGDVRVTAKFETDGSEKYKLQFADEFNTADGTQPDATYWSRCSRETPTWKRFTSQTTEGQAKTGYIKDGKLVMRCVANDIDDEGDVDMISGAVESSSKMKFAYGRIEARLRTTPHRGNFPAFWLMPEDNSAGWPNAGEIDIWEQIDTENKTYHTVHTHCTYDLGLAKPNSGSTTANASEWHVFTLDWTPDLLTWYVDGAKAFSYAKSTDATLLEKGQWPFDKPFYVILNQSVGNGSWAANCDTSFDYETLFDYVRLYQTDDQVATGVKSLSSDDATITAVYGLDGARRNTTERGVNIVKMSDGSVKKVVVK